MNKKDKLNFRMAILLGMMLWLFAGQISAQEPDGAVVGAEIKNENLVIKDFKKLFNAQLESIENAAYLSYSQNISKERFVFFVSSLIKLENNKYTFQITLWADGIDIRSFTKTTKVVDEEVLDWVNQVVQNINYYNGGGEGKFLQEILIYRPAIKVTDGLEADMFDTRNTLKIQNRIYKILQSNTELRERCILEKVDIPYAGPDEENESLAYFYCTYKKVNISDSPINLFLFLDFAEPCFESKIDFGMPDEIKLGELDKYIEPNWVQNFLINRNCN